MPISQEMPGLEQNKLIPIDVLRDDLLNKWFIVIYDFDGKPYPGVIKGYDESTLEVKCMSRIGQNRSFWPLFDDEFKYPHSNVITLMNEPQKITERRNHFMVERAVWSLVEKYVEQESNVFPVGAGTNCAFYW